MDFTQAPFYVQDDLAMTLQLPESNVRVIKPVTGGGFGGKADGMDDNDFCASLLSILTGRPVRITYTREEEFLVTRRRHPTIIYLRAAVARDGTILSKECRLTLDGGAYNFQGGIAPIVFSARLGLPYRHQALRYEAVRAYTNKSPSGAMRGFGSPQMHFAQDVQMELIARDMGMDPVELRLKNGLEAGEKTVQGFHVFSSGFKQALERLREASPARPRAGIRGSYLGLGHGLYRVPLWVRQEGTSRHRGLFRGHCPCPFRRDGDAADRRLRRGPGVRDHPFSYCGRGAGHSSRARPSHSRGYSPHAHGLRYL